MHGLPTIGTIGFGWFDVSGRRRVPSPPAITTAFIAVTLSAPCDVEQRGATRQPTPIQKSQSGQLVCVVRDHRAADRRGRAARSPPCRAMFTSSRSRAARARAPASSSEVAHGDHDEGRPGQPVVRDEQDHRGIDHQPVGERVGELAEPRLDVPAAREEAVHLVGDAGDAEDDPGRPAAAVARRTTSATKTGISARRPSVSAFGSCAAAPDRAASPSRDSVRRSACPDRQRSARKRPAQYTVRSR